MKKSLLFAAAAISALGMSAAIQPMEVSGGFQYVSPDGKYVGAVDNGYILIVEAANSANSVEFDGETDGNYYGLGTFGGAFSNTGLAVGHITDYTPAVLDIAKREWTPLKTLASGISNAWSITPDGTMIVGFSAIDTPESEFNFDGDYTSSTPVYWTRNDDGSWSDPVRLPAPKLDFTNRAPQWIHANYVAPDGSVITGAIQDCMGTFYYFITWTKNDKGEWEYKTMGESLINPTGVRFPEWYPTDFEIDNKPQYTDFMTEEELAAFNAAVEDYWNNIIAEYPEQTDFMTAAELEEYDKAATEYNIKYAENQEKQAPWFDAFYKILDTEGGYIPDYNEDYYNGGMIVCSGKLLIDLDTYEERTAVAAVDPLTGESKIYKNDMDLQAVGVTYDGTILATSLDMTNYTDIAYVIKPGTEAPVRLEEWVNELNPTLGEWINDNMTHSVSVFDWDTFEETTVDVLVTGIPWAAANANLISCVCDNAWDLADDSPYQYSYLLPLDLNQNLPGNAINTIEAETDATPVYYNLQGVRVINPDNGIFIRVEGKNATKVIR